MRTIKFRGKSIYGKREWIYGCILQFKHQFYIVPDVEKIDLKIYRVIPETVGQFTGLTDKNGKEIYEGDIICRKKIRGLDKYKIVIWHNAYVATGFNISNTKERIIIGNIYDNPELVEQP